MRRNSIFTYNSNNMTNMLFFILIPEQASRQVRHTAQAKYSPLGDFPQCRHGQALLLFLLFPKQSGRDTIQDRFSACCKGSTNRTKQHFFASDETAGSVLGQMRITEESTFGAGIKQLRDTSNSFFTSA
jgi:hypothetical protein